MPLLMNTRVYFPAAGARRALCAGTVFPGIFSLRCGMARGGMWKCVWGVGGGGGGARDEQLPFDAAGRLVFPFGCLFLGVSLAPVSNISGDANHFGGHMLPFLQHHCSTSCVHHMIKSKHLFSSLCEKHPRPPHPLH